MRSSSITRRSGCLALALAFLTTRATLVWTALGSAPHRPSMTDVSLYEAVARAVVDGHAVPYADVAFEYPPGALVVAVLPALAPADYLTAFVLVMLVLDTAALVGLVRLSASGGSPLGPWVWAVVVPLLGPVAYGRLDLAAAAATIWAAERLAAGRAGGAGVCLGVGALVKAYPLALVPAAAIAVRRSRALLIGLVAVVAIGTAPFLPVIGSLLRGVLGYHADRGLAAESSGGALLLSIDQVAGGATLEFSSGSLNVEAHGVGAVRAAGVVLAVGILLLSVWAATALRRSGTAGPGHLADLLFATLAGLVAVSTVLSPQYVLWLVAAGAAAACYRASVVRAPVVLLAPVAIATHLFFPFHFTDFAAGDRSALALLVARDALLVGIAVLSLRRVARRIRVDGAKGVTVATGLDDAGADVTPRHGS